MKPTLTFIGHGSLKMQTGSGKVIYVDPFFKGDYNQPADLVLITHNHRDHNNIHLITQNTGCTVIRPEQALTDGIYQSFSFGEIQVTAVQAYNDHHKKEECVGYVLSFDGLKIYCAGDTSGTEDMKTKLPQMGLDYALLPIDGIYNFGPEEASQFAQSLHARHVIPIHNNPLAAMTGIYSAKGTKKFSHPGKIVMKFGEVIPLESNL